jgi:hypothetical protein
VLANETHGSFAQRLRGGAEGIGLQTELWRRLVATTPRRPRCGRTAPTRRPDDDGRPRYGAAADARSMRCVVDGCSGCRRCSSSTYLRCRR